MEGEDTGRDEMKLVLFILMVGLIVSPCLGSKETWIIQSDSYSGEVEINPNHTGVIRVDGYPEIGFMWNPVGCVLGSPCNKFEAHCFWYTVPFEVLKIGDDYIIVSERFSNARLVRSHG